MDRESLKQLSAALRFAADRCEKALSDGSYQTENPIQDLARFIASLCENDRVGGSLPDWFSELEKETLRELIRRGARTSQMSKFLGGKKADNVRQFLHMRGITFSGVLNCDD